MPDDGSSRSRRSGSVASAVAISTFLSVPYERPCTGVSRTDIDALRSPALATTAPEGLALQPPPDGRGHRPQAVGLEDEREDGQHARERLDEEPGALLDVGDPEVLGELGQPVACQHE